MAVDLKVDDSEEGTRLDVLLVRRVDGMSRAKARRLIGDGLVRLNGRRARKGVRLSAGDEVHLRELPPPPDFDASPGEGELSVVFEDPHLVIVDKPAGMPAHPLKPSETDTLANRLVARYPQMRGVGYARREPGLLHRLDNDTSGLLVAACSQEAFERMRKALLELEIDKRYLVLVDGELAPRLIEHRIAKHPSDPRRVHVCVDALDRRLPASRPARTEILTAKPFGARTLLEVSAPRAHRHQVRAHFAAIGHPLVGDWLYGGSSVVDFARHFLHASEIRMLHPMTGAPLAVRAPLPPELERLLA